MWGMGVLCAIIALLVISLTHLVVKSKNPKYKNGVLPPGSMGFPLIGETLQFLIPGRSLDVHPFLQKRIQRYGKVFRTNLLGHPMVVSADPEVNHYLFMQEGKAVELWYLNNMSKLLSEKRDNKSHYSFTASHRYIKTTFMKHVGVASLKKKLLPQIEELVHETLNSWSKKESINVNTAVAKMGFNFMASQFNHDMAKDLEHLNESFVCFLNTIMSFPVNMPGTAFHDSLKKRELIANVIREKLHEKLNSPEGYQGDLLDELIKDMKTETFITEEFAVRFVLRALFVASETLALTLTLAFKLLSEHPSIVENLQAEHDKIVSKRNPGSPLTWTEYQSMTFTLQVINEVLRLLNPLPGNLRKATQDIQVNGYIIPQGWTILIASSAQHLNPNIYKNPLTFNPHRWKELDSSVVSKNFMPFGVGGRQCSGAEFARAFMSIFFHVLCTKYRWIKVNGGDNISRKPHLDFGDKVHINVCSATLD